jgi:hypothetical protein
MKNIASILVIALSAVLLSFSFKPATHPTVPGGEQLSGPSLSLPTAVAASDLIIADTNITRWGGRATNPDTILINNPPNQDNTFRQMTNRFYSPVDGTGADTITLAPQAFNTIVQYTATDSLGFQVKTFTNCYIGDQLTFIVLSNGSSQKVKFIGTAWQASTSGGASISLTSGKRATIVWMFDGTYWLEQSRNVQ